MTGDRGALVDYRLERARDSLEEAALLLDAGRANAAVNRLYYACLYAVSAAILSRGLSSPKHTGVRSLFHRHLVRRSGTPRKVFDLVFNNRQKGDYSDFARFDVEAVRPWLDQTIEFVERLAEVIQSSEPHDCPRTGYGIIFP